MKRVRIKKEVFADARQRLVMQKLANLTNAVGLMSSPQNTTVEPFKFPAVMDGVLPKGNKGMAMDNAITGAFQWGNSVPLLFANAAFAEGMEFLGYPYLTMLSQRPEYRVISEIPAGDMTRKWIEFQSDGDEGAKNERIKQLQEEFDRLKVQDRFRQMAEYDGFMGRAHLFIDCCDPDDREELLTNIGDGKARISKAKLGKGKLKRLVPVEAIWCYPNKYNTNDPLKPHWYRPETWFSMGKEIHGSRFLTFVGRPVPDLLKPAYCFGGLSMSQIAKPYVDNWLRIRQNVADITQAFSIVGLKTDLSESLNMAGQLLFQRINLFNLTRNNKGCFIIDKESEEFWNVAVPLGTLDALQAQAQEHMAAVARIPLVKLLGIQPTGLNASSEGEIRTYYDSILEYQETFFRPHLTTIMHFAMLNIWGEIDPEIKFKFVPLWSLDEKSAAEVQEVKARTGQLLVDGGIVSQEEERKRVANDPDTQYDGLDVDDLPELKQEEESGLVPKGGGGGLKSVLGEGGEGGGETEEQANNPGEPKQPNLKPSGPKAPKQANGASGGKMKQPERV